MKLRVSHLSRYEYDHEISFSPHLIYLRPRESAWQHLGFHRLVVQPDAKISHLRDSADNNYALVHFRERSRLLEIVSQFELETTFANPFDFILDAQAVEFPLRYTEADAFALGPSLAPPFDDTQQRLRAWLDEYFVNRPADTVAYLGALNQAIFQTLRYTRREDEGIQSATRTLELGTGACRDSAVLFIEILRTLGVAARFVSGYRYAPPADDQRSAGAMHAWVEVYLPGGGWRGLDPTHGIWCDDSFIPVAHAAQAGTINPIQGDIYAPGPVSSRLHADILIERLDSLPLAPQPSST